MQKAGMILGGHSHEHRPLATLRYPELYQDLTKNWDLIQKNLQPQHLWPFSYPYGKSDSFNRNTVEILRQLGYRVSLCTEPGNNLPGIDLFAVRRVDCKDILARANNQEIPHFAGVSQETACQSQSSNAPVA
jgi:peptidoglycan/xylan/chitin deacetylase (PgdA/CDA1 family)